MDDKGFIFTADATLALIVIMVVTASLMAYYMMPVYNGQDHEHLESLADSVLATMEQDGTLRTAAVQSANGNNTGAQDTLNSELNRLVPGGIAYNLTLSSTNPVSVQNDRGIVIAHDTATKVKVITGPQEGWMGRAQYLRENVSFVPQDQNVITTAWNFHNWLTNFAPWSSNGISSNPSWGRSGGNPQYITFPVPNGTINSVTVLFGSNCHNSPIYDRWGNIIGVNNGGPSYGVNFKIGTNTYNVPNTNFQSLYTGTTGSMYNAKLDIPATSLTPAATNQFYISFVNAVPNFSYRYYSYEGSDMPWFSILNNFKTTIMVPQGVNQPVYTYFDNVSGLASYNPNIVVNYTLSTGAVNQINNRYTPVDWSDLTNPNSDPDPTRTLTPYVLTNIPNAGNNPGQSAPGSAVTVVKHVNVPDEANLRLLDSYLVVNSFGAVDGALVQVGDPIPGDSQGRGRNWRTVFCSFDLNGKDYSDRADGYGNLPGLIYLGDDNHTSLNLLHHGDNLVRITVWDDAPGGDYDLVGLVSSYVSITTTKLPIQWYNFPFDSHQYSTQTASQTKQFSIGPEAQSALLFIGVGLDSKTIKVDVTDQSGNTNTLYPTGPVPYYVDLKAADDASSKHIITDGNDNLLQGNYQLKITVTAGSSWESGDFGGTSHTIQSGANAEIFSGTRVTVLYPKFLQNVWATAYASNASAAKQLAYNNLVSVLNDAGIPVDDSLIRTEALYTGDLPNAIPVRLDLWKQ